REKSSDSPSRTSPTTFLTARWRAEVPMTSCAPLTTASIGAWRTLEGPQPKRPSEGMRSGESLRSGLVMPGVYGGMNNMWPPKWRKSCEVCDMRHLAGLVKCIKNCQNCEEWVTYPLPQMGLDVT